MPMDEQETYLNLAQDLRDCIDCIENKAKRNMLLSYIGFLREVRKAKAL